MLPVLMLVRSPDTGHVPSFTPIEGGPVVVGRAPTTHDSVTVDDPSMSREHFRVVHNDSGKLQVEDLNSTNGVLVGDRMLRSESAEIVVGEVMRAGNSIWVAVPSSHSVSKGFFITGGEEWVGYSARLLEFKEHLELVQERGPIWLTGHQCRHSQLKVARALATHRGLKLQVDGASPEKGALWFTSEDAVGKHHENTVLTSAEAKEPPSGFQILDIPSPLEQSEDRLLLFEDIAHRWTDELMYHSVDIPYSLLRWDSCSDLFDFETVIRSMVQTLRPMEVLDESHLEMAGIAVIPYGEGEKRLKPTKEELVNVLVEQGGSVRATAALYDVQRTQIYRWMRAYAINIDELREG